jgi:hypothetical protein
MAWEYKELGERYGIFKVASTFGGLKGYSKFRETISQGELEKLLL